MHVDFCVFVCVCVPQGEISIYLAYAPIQRKRIELFRGQDGNSFANFIGSNKFQVFSLIHGMEMNRIWKRD